MEEDSEEEDKEEDEEVAPTWNSFDELSCQWALFHSRASPLGSTMNGAQWVP